MTKTTTTPTATKTFGTLEAGDIVKAGRNRRAVIMNPRNAHGHATFRYIVKGRLAKSEPYIYVSNVDTKADTPVDVFGVYAGDDMPAA